MKHFVKSFVFCCLCSIGAVEAINVPSTVLTIIKTGNVIEGLDLRRGLRFVWKESHWELRDTVRTRLSDERLKYLGFATPLLQKDGTYLLSASGFGHVWSYRPGGNLTRLDSTFFAGATFYNALFQIDQILYSAGGYGFWHAHSIISYYDKQSQEWEMVHIKGEYPTTLSRAIHGSNGKKGRILWGPTSEKQGGINFEGHGEGVYLYTPKNSTLQKVGVVPDFLRNDRSPLSLLGTWDTLAMANSLNNTVYLFNFKTNEVRVLPSQKTLTGAFQKMNSENLGAVGVIDGLLVFRKSNESKKSIMLDFYSIQELWDMATPYCAAYEPYSLYWLKKYYPFVGGFFLIILLSMALRSLRFRSPTDRSLRFVGVLTKNEKQVLEMLLKARREDRFNSHDIDSWLGVQDKSFENQRKIRGLTLKGLNEKCILYLQLPSAIQEMRDSEDRREKLYFAEPTLYALRLELLEKINAWEPL